MVNMVICVLVKVVGLLGGIILLYFMDGLFGLVSIKVVVLIVVVIMGIFVRVVLVMVSGSFFESDEFINSYVFFSVWFGLLNFLRVMWFVRLYDLISWYMLMLYFGFLFFVL